MSNPHSVVGTRFIVSLFLIFFLTGCTLIDSVLNTPSDAPPPPIYTQPTTTNTAIPTESSDQVIDVPTAVSTPVPPTPLPEPTPAPRLDFFVPDNIDQTLPSAQAYANLEQIWSMPLPPNDLYDTTRRLNPWLDVGERTVSVPPADLGDVRTFQIDEDTRTAELRAVSEHFYFWFQEGMEVDQADIDAAIDRLETDFFPRLTQLFGEPWSPGVDGDPRMSVLHLEDFGSYTDLGYFDSVNQYPTELDAYSNQAEMLFMNMQDLKITDELYLGTLVHEMHHLIHWSQDSNEDAWLDEGLAQLGELYLGFDTAETSDYFYDTSTPLTGWSDDEVEVFKNYSVSYLFAVYLWERLGDQAIKSIVADDANSLASVRNAIQQFEPTATLEEVLDDWAVTNWLDTGFYNENHVYENLTIGLPELEARVGKFPFEITSGIPQYGVHYIQIQETGNLTLEFAGNATVPLIPVDQPLETAVWFAPPQDNMDATLTVPLDLTALNTATVEYEVWHELEEEYDVTYVLISTDDGKSWEAWEDEEGRMIPAEYAFGYTGNSDQWETNTLDLSLFAGQSLLLRFETITDFSFHEAGFAVRNIRLQETAYTPQPTDFTANGYIYTQDIIPQTWSLQLIQDKQVTKIPLNPYNQAQQNITITDPNAVLILMPQSPLPNTSATYYLSLRE